MMPHHASPLPPADASVAADLVAVLVAVVGGNPVVLTVMDGRALPSGALEPGQRSLQAGLRAWVERQTRHPIGYVEQLYTFADSGRIGDARAISISYLGLTRAVPADFAGQAGWSEWYRYFPWEDWRDGRPPLLDAAVAPALLGWAGAADSLAERQNRQDRARINFALGEPWSDELVLQRYELLYEAGLTPEAGAPPHAVPGAPMLHDHRRILATGIARLRAKIKYRPVLFELMPHEFTLLQLQLCAEALAGQRTHKQNFRRLMEQQALVEETGRMATGAGRPAKLVQFRRAVRQERALGGSKLPRTS